GSRECRSAVLYLRAGGAPRAGLLSRAIDLFRRQEDSGRHRHAARGTDLHRENGRNLVAPQVADDDHVTFAERAVERFQRAFDRSLRTGASSRAAFCPYSRDAISAERGLEEKLRHVALRSSTDIAPSRRRFALATESMARRTWTRIPRPIIQATARCGRRPRA